MIIFHAINHNGFKENNILLGYLFEESAEVTAVLSPASSWESVGSREIAEVLLKTTIYSWYSNTSSTDTPNTFEILRASRRDGLYLNASRAMMVCRVTWARSANFFCVISPCSKRKRRIWFFSLADSTVCTSSILYKGNYRGYQNF